MNSLPQPSTSVFSRFESICRASPEAVAVVDDGHLITYRQINEKVSLLCEQMIFQGLADSHYLPIVASRCVPYLVTLLACCKLGIAYVAIDPTNPAERIGTILDQLGCSHVLIIGLPVGFYIDERVTRFHLDETGRLNTQGPIFIPLVSRQSADSAVITVMFTSGTTGRAKGVRISQCGLLNLVDNVQGQVPVHTGSYVHHSSIGFDAALFEVWVPLLTGARLTLHAPAFNIETLAERVLAARCDVLLLTTSLFHLVVQHRAQMLDKVHFLYVGGEVLKPVHVRALFESNPGITLVNGYGPTENTVFSTWHILRNTKDAELDVIPIGRLLRNINAKVVGADLQEVPAGECGELLLSGNNLSLGYLDSEQTDARFLRLPDAVYYRTGDYVTQTSNGVFFYQGRVDEQVKIKGYRVEIAEVEHVLMGLPGIAQAVVLTKQMNTIENCLLAFIVFKQGSLDIDEGKLLRLLSDQLPHYMLPTRIHRLVELPVTANGKVDKRFLRSLDMQDKDTHHNDASNQQIGLTVREVWSDVLGTQNLEMERSIYAYGASSLSVVMAHTQMNKALHRSTPFNDVVRLSTLQEWVDYYLTH